jgi:hypothetical protein
MMMMKPMEIIVLFYINLGEENDIISGQRLEILKSNEKFMK